MSRSHFVIALAPFVAAILFSPSARADDWEHFWNEGTKLRQSSKCSEAIFSFRKALELRPEKLGSLLNIAWCEEDLGQFASARADWSRLRTALLSNKELDYKDWTKTAEEHYSALEAKVSWITVRVSGNAPNRMQVTVDGRPLHPDLVGTELERDPGPHTIEVSYGGASPLHAERTLAEGAHEVVTLAIPDDPTFGGSRRRTIGILTLAVGGGVSTVVAAIAIGVRQHEIASINQYCANGGCPRGSSNYTQAIDARSVGTLANGVMDTFAILGGASLAVGIPLVVTGSSWSPARSGALTSAVGSAAGAQISMGPAVGGVGMQITGRF